MSDLRYSTDNGVDTARQWRESEAIGGDAVGI